MKVKDLLKVLYPNQLIRIFNYTSCLDTDICSKYDDRIRPFLNYKIFKISHSADVLRIEVETNNG